MAENEKTAEVKKAPAVVKEKKPESPRDFIPKKTICSKCGKTVLCYKWRYLKIMLKSIGEAGTYPGPNSEENDLKCIKENLGGIGSTKWNHALDETTKTFLCRACRPKPVKKEKKVKAVKEATPAPAKV